MEVEAELARLLEAERRARLRAGKLQEIVAALSRTAGFDAHAAKPIDVDALLGAISDGLTHAAARSAR